MALISRSEGSEIRNLSTLRRFMPYLMPRRNEAAIYFKQTIDVTDTLQYLAKYKGQSSEITFFHLVLASMLRAEAMRPWMNRFVAGKKIYQRNDLAISFAVKKRLSDEAGMTAVKVIFESGDTLMDVAKRVNEVINSGRSEKLTASEKEMKLTIHLPDFAIRFLFWLQRVLDGFNLLPDALIKNDPLYATLFVANLGSLGLEAPYHHLYEYGTVPIFAAIGKIKKIPMVMPDGQIAARDAVTFRYTFDERITDGLYCAKSLQLFEEFLKNPHLLEQPLVQASVEQVPEPERVRGVPAKA